MTPHKFLTAQGAREFILSGAAVCTLVSEETGDRYTLKVQKGDNVHFVKLRIGPDSNTHWMLVGIIKYGLFQQTAKMKDFYTTPFRAFQYMWQRLVRDQIAPKLEIWHEGRCGRCGRTLTVPESIERGFGPECIEIVEAEKNLHGNR